MFGIPFVRACQCVGSRDGVRAADSGIMEARAHVEAPACFPVKPHAWLRRYAFLMPLVVACLALAQMGNAHAADAVVGSVLAVRGAVFVDAGAGQQPLVAKAPVHRGNTIISVAGKAQIGFSDGSIISIGENSRVRIANYETTGGAASARIGLLSGVLRLLVIKLAPSGRFEVETETAVAAVRGTDWVIEATRAQTSVAIVSGVVAVSGRNGHSAASVVLDTSGQGTDVRRDSAPTPVARWGAQRFAETLARATFE